MNIEGTSMCYECVLSVKNVSFMNYGNVIYII